MCDGGEYCPVSKAATLPDGRGTAVFTIAGRDSVRRCCEDLSVTACNRIRLAAVHSARANRPENRVASALVHYPARTHRDARRVEARTAQAPFEGLAPER